jgi:hypothetical protein
MKKATKKFLLSDAGGFPKSNGEEENTQSQCENQNVGNAFHIRIS